MDARKYAALFQQEGREHLQRCTRLLLEWERAPGATDAVDELFRSVHTIKGMAAAMGYARVTDLAHHAESVLGAVRAKTVPANAERIDLLVRTVDALAEAVTLAPDEAPVDAELDAALEAAAVATPARARARTKDRRRSKGASAPPAAEPAPVPAPVGRPVATAVTPAARAAIAADELIRVPRGRLDTMVRLASELMVTRTRLDARSAALNDAALDEIGAQAGRLIRGLHDGLLEARLVPVGDVFDRFPRLVRDVARALGKEVTLETEGGGIELDRAVLDALAEPLVHLLRNAVDHGIEAPAARVAAGKPAAGTIRLVAARSSEGATITVTDDGRGIDQAKVAERAKREGLAADAAALDAGALLALLARPGFSTAERVSDVSGRGVGVDAVVTAVRRLGGAVSLATEPGRRTSWTLRVPATLTVVRALLTRAGRIRMAIPFGMIAETTLLPPGSGADAPVARVRGEDLPLRDLGRLAGEAPAHDPARRRPAVVLDVAGRRTVLTVDALLGQQEIVLERFVAPAGLPAYVGGATILGDGSPALVLDAAAIGEERR